MIVSLIVPNIRLLDECVFQLYTHLKSECDLFAVQLWLLLFFVQGDLVNCIERCVVEALDYVEEAKDRIPQCKKFKKTSKRVT